MFCQAVESESGSNVAGGNWSQISTGKIILSADPGGKGGARAAGIGRFPNRGLTTCEPVRDFATQTAVNRSLTRACHTTSPRLFCPSDIASTTCPHACKINAQSTTFPLKHNTQRWCVIDVCHAREGRIQLTHILVPMFSAGSNPLYTGYACSKIVRWTAH